MTEQADSAAGRPGEYVLLRLIGSGSYGKVWLARNALGGFCAVKVVERRSFESDRPYEREFSGIQKYEPISRSHPHLVNVLHVGRNDEAGFFYYVMELADNLPHSSLPATPSFNVENYEPRTLKSELRRRSRLPVSECVEIGQALAGALQHLHERGLVHRDVKPANVIHVHGVPRLADIGLVTDAGDARSFVGTEGFIPPEGPGSPQADLYSLGKLLYEISTGKDRTEYPEPVTRLAELPDREALLELNTIVHRACQPRISARYPSAAEMLDDLRALRTGKSVRRRRRRALHLSRVLQALSFAGVCAVAIWAAVLLKNDDRSRAIPKDAIALVTRAVEGSPTTREGFEQILQYCHRALEIAPDYADAFVALANAYREAAGWHRPERQAMIEARQAAFRALQLDGQNAGAHIQLALVQMLHDWDYQAAETSFRRGLALNRANAWNLVAYAELLRATGQLAESRALVEESLRARSNGQNFGSINDLTDLALQLYAERDFAAMLDQTRVMAEARPNLILPRIYAGLAYAGLGDYDKALAEFNFARAREDAPDLMALAAYCHGKRGEREEALALLKRLDDFAPVVEVSPYYRAYVFAGLNDADQVFAQFDAALATRSGHLVGYSWRGLLKDAIWIPFHGDPRWTPLVAKVGILKFAEERARQGPSGSTTVR